MPTWLKHAIDAFIALIAVVVVSLFGWQGALAAGTFIVLAVLALFLSIRRNKPEVATIVEWKFFFSPRWREGSFIVPTGYQGIWAKPRKPGTWEVIPFWRVFAKIHELPLTEIPPTHCGIIEALDGVPPEEETQTVSAKEFEYKDIVNGDAFLLGKGERGLQLTVLPPGSKHVLNTLLFRVTTNTPETQLVEVKAGMVAVLISNVGKEPSETEREYVGDTSRGKPAFMLAAEVLNKRGVVQNPLFPGTHPVNRRAYSFVLVDTTPTRVTMDGKTESQIGGVSHKFPTPRAVTRNGHTIPMQIELVIEVPPEHAPRLVALGGTFLEFIQDVVVPYLDDIAQTEVSEMDTVKVIQERRKLRDFMESAIRSALEGPTAAREAIPADQMTPDMERAIRRGEQIDKRQHYPMKVNTLRLMEIDFSQEKGPVADFVAILHREANAAEEVRVVKAETGVREEQIALEVKEADATRQATEMAGRGIATVANSMDKLHWTTQVAAMVLAHNDTREFIDAVSEVLHEKARDLHAGHKDHDKKGDRDKKGGITTKTEVITQP